MSILLWGLKERGRDCRTISSSVGVSRTWGGNSPEKKRRRNKRFLGASGGKGWLRRENHECSGSFQQEVAFTLNSRQQLY